MYCDYTYRFRWSPLLRKLCSRWVCRLEIFHLQLERSFASLIQLKEILRACSDGGIFNSTGQKETKVPSQWCILVKYDIGITMLNIGLNQLVYDSFTNNYMGLASSRYWSREIVRNTDRNCDLLRTRQHPIWTSIRIKYVETETLFSLSNPLIEGIELKIVPLESYGRNVLKIKPRKVAWSKDNRIPLPNLWKPRVWCCLETEKKIWGSVSAVNALKTVLLREI